MKSRRFLPPRSEAAVETKASHEVMELVRQNPKLGLLVIKLREAGRSWLTVKTEIEAKINRARRGRGNGRVTRSS
jgi:hypothetical protein